MRRAVPALLFMFLLGGCAATKEPLPLTSPADAKVAPVARVPLDAYAQPPAAKVPSAPSTSVEASAPRIAAPPGTLYVCVSENAGERQQTAIEFAPKVGALCKRHPEMGPCQYERDLCRRSGGRVYAASGQEITQQIEDEYDRKVLRVRFRAN
jgi:hypothetical protein